MRTPSSPFDPRWVARLGGLVFRPRATARSPLAGHHESVRRGRAGEFEDRRAYAPGDDRRRIDWKVFARSDRWTVREEREDATLSVSLLLDVSASMAFSADQRMPKRRYAAGLLAALGYVLHQSRDAVGWGFFEQSLLSFQPPRAGADVLSRLLAQLTVLPSGTTADFQKAFHSFLSQRGGRGAVVVVSDFWGPLDGMISGFRWLRTVSKDVSALQVLDPVELDLSFSGIRRFEDLESADRLRADPTVLAESYQKKMADRQSSLIHQLGSLSVDHYLFRTDKPVDESLAHFLHRRESRG